MMSTSNIILEESGVHMGALRVVAQLLLSPFPMMPSPSSATAGHVDTAPVGGRHTQIFDEGLNGYAHRLQVLVQVREIGTRDLLSNGRHTRC